MPVACDPSFSRPGGSESLNKKTDSSSSRKTSEVSSPQSPDGGANQVNSDGNSTSSASMAPGHQQSTTATTTATTTTPTSTATTTTTAATAHTRLTSSVLRAYHRLFKSFRKAWTGVRFDDEVEAIPLPAPRHQPDRIGDLLKRTKFNRSELKVMYQGFKQVCPSGLVDENTFRDIYAQFFPQGDATLYAHYLFLAFDQDHNGTVTFHDFVTGLSALSRGSPLEKLRWTFNLYDINGDGCITRDEMMEIIHSVYSLNADNSPEGPNGTNEVPQQHANRVFQKLDANNDGIVTFDEFVSTCLSDQNIIKSLSILDTVL
ncbi:Kv channel-interacting protein 1 [Galendromus occidentalis]|uniref:Kv channel-interacting protein 1 n=1 Tax=Galendromus occidentalis TaxID=34638 RepID=A0AAJ7L895_9ACAR|nr:Kv channel-interacting protein 1 [Galendromus occidentalis]